VVLYRGIPDSIRKLASMMKPGISEKSLDTTCRMYHEQNGDTWERDMVKDLKMRLEEQSRRSEVRYGPNGKPLDGYIGTEEG
jgi:hypothetical protein